MATTTTHDAVDDREPTARIVDGALILTDFVEDDPGVVSSLAGRDDLEAAVHRYLRVGALAASGAQVAMETGHVERAFDGMQADFETKLTDAVRSIGTAADELLDEHDGALPKVLDELKRDLDELLGSTFDPDSKRSVIGKLEAVLEQAAGQVDRLVRRALDPDSDDSPLRRYTTEIVATVKDQIGELRHEVQDLSTRLAVDAARTEELERSATKGFAFEDLVHETAAAIAADHGDIAEAVGRTAGILGTQAGDELVTVNPDDTCGLGAAFALEVKDRKLGIRKTHEELDAAIANREASCAIAVFSRPGLAPASVPFQWSGNKAVVVLDKDDPDDRAFRLAYMWARWIARRQLASEETLDLGRVEASLVDARHALERVANVKRCHSTARKKIDEAGREVEALADEVDIALAEVRKQIAG
jgi:hypothetical protein